MNRILVITDTWHPQVNGVVRSLEALATAALDLGANVQFLTPQGFRSFRMPTYPEIRLAVTTTTNVARRIEALSVSHVHIATEGPAPTSACLYGVLQFRENPSISEQGCADAAGFSNRWAHLCEPNSRRITSCIVFFECCRFPPRTVIGE
jgi:hypothetical protein